ncbi:hypothetical protein X777_15633 [Ooceraea biroi]|uniref:C2H2-type domain-containing protein n=1 Tax=Ooceraea biroi TaxID=2015173 RepID=A0A026VUY6_OOCBI|nr:hypothetical protein X777_15633 [Ooceraea biroi]
MNYGGNMPDWHQYNSPQAGISDVTSTAQNVNSGHLPFISSINSSCPTQLNGLNLGSDGLEKHQSDPNFNPRHFQQHLPANLSHGHNATDNAPLASMVQMQNCIGHYGPSSTRNPMVDNLNGPMDPRNTAMTGLNEELSYRSNQVPLSGPMSHMNGPSVMSMSAPHGPIGPRSANASSNSHAASRTGPPPPSSFVACKAPCCNPDPNYQQWEKYCSYQNNAYRENIRTNGYQADARRFGGDFNFRKDNFDGKEILPPASAPNASDHRRNFPDFKYRKERAVSRSYPSNSGMLHSYPSMQNYNYAGDYQKYPYPNIKEYPKANSMSVPPSQSMVKHQQEQSFAHQQKYNKSMSYQNNGAMMSTSVPNPNMLPSAQNSYFNSQQYPRNPSTDTSQHDCQAATNDSATTMMNARMQPSNMHAQYQQVYQQKLAMQRFSMENHLREMTRIPGYQSHPKYKECVLRYREILKLQQSVAYQGQMPSQPQTQQSCVAATTVNTAVPSINLQFDQNGVLINSNYIPEGFPRMQQVSNSQASDNLVDKQGKQDDGNPAEMMNHNVQKREQLVSQQHDNQAIVLCAKGMQPQDRYSVQKNLNQSQFEMQAPGNEDFSDLSASASDAAARQKMPKQFADKPELDVRQFLANWDESEDEDGANANLPSAVLSDSTPVVVVGYENVDLSAKTLEGLEGSKSGRITTDVITFENQDKSNVSVMPAQDCLTISYASAENVEVTKDPACKEIAKESIVQPGSHIIQCISNGPDEVPTIHIVDNLEIGSILQVTNGQVTETLGGQDALSFLQDNAKVQASTITIETDKFKKTNGNSESAADYNASKEEYVVENSSPAEAVEGGTSQAAQGGDQRVTALPASVKSNLDSAQDVNLKKQNSFASEESHNPDDISLPDLHTSECTPISTTLNTPIHSDTEESSERVQDLTISTNPIEIIQNSPMISFTQSPTKSEPYDHLSNEGEARNRSAGSLESRYQTEDRNNDVLDHDAVLGTFEFSANVNKDESTAENGKESASLNGDAVSANNSGRTFLDGEAERSEATSVCMTLTSGEYELKIVSAQNVGTSSKSTREYKSSSLDCHANESQTAAVASKTAADDNCSTKIVKTNPSALLGAKRSTSSNDKLRKRETSDKSAKEDSSSENNGNKSLKIDAKDLKNSWQIIKDHKKSILNDQANSHHARKCSPANATEKSNEIMHQDKHRGKSDILRNKPRIIDNVSIDDSGERMRLLKEYRRIKHKSSTMEIQGKSKVCSSSDPDEHSVLQVPSDKQLCQKDGKFKLAEEREKKNANILKKFVTKNVNPDFAIQVTNVNLKRKDNDEQKESQRSGEETKNSGPLDAIKIEINVSCTERNTTEKLLHENIKNAVAETIGHLTSSISSGARSNSANLKEIQCDKDGLDGREKRNRSQPEASTYNEVRKDQSNAEVMKYKSLITACKEDIAMDETSGSLIPRKKRSSSSERELIHDNGNISINTETALSSAETLKPEHAMVRRRSIHQDTERKAVAANFSGSDDLKTPSEKKEYQEATVASACRNVRNLQDDIASRLNAIPSTSSSTVDPSLENANYDNPTHFDYNHFDVAPNENLDVNDKRTDRWKRPRKDDGKFNNFEPYETASVYVNPIFFSADKLENLNTVPVYTTKDGKITYSPNPRFTYRELLMEARAKDNYGSARESSYFASSPLDYNCSRLRKVFKRNREVLTAIRKRSEIDFADGKLQSAAKHVNYLPNKNAALKSAHCAKARGTPHLEFFNDDADKLYANRNKQESQPDEIQSDTTALVEEARSCSSKAADKNTHGTEEGRGSPSDDNDQETLEAEHLTGNDAHVHGQEDKSAAESANAKRVSNSSPTEVALPESNAERLSDEPKCTEATEESALNDADEVDDSAKNNSDSAVDETTACQEVSSAPVGGKANDEDTFMAKSISPEVDFGERNEQNGACSEETSKEPIVPQGLSDVALTERPQLDEEDTEQQSRKLDVEREVTEASSLGNEATNVDEVDDCNAAMTPKPVASLDLLAISTEKSVCDLFTSETPEQNISEFTVIKSIIAGDKKNEHQEPETKDGAKVCDSMIDSKLLCMDSSDCGIYAEDKCALTRMSEHDFTEEDSMVPMEWETSQIQEDAVNRLCSMDESSIDFAAAAANSLQDSSLLHNLSLSIPVKESTTPETAVAIESRSSVSAPAIEPPPEMEKMTPSNEGDKEQASSSEHEKMACLPATDCNAGTKMVPKLVIKKSDIDNMIHKSLLKRGCQPKIPKMIIRNARSRPGTPSIESVHEEVPVQINISDRMSRASEEPCENDSESSLQESNDYRSKIPKMKIKLDDKHSNKIMRAEDTTELSVKRKNIKKTIPKVKIKNSSRIDLSDNSVCSTTSQDSRKSLEKYEEKIPILKLKKQERNRSSSPEASRKRQGSSHSEMPSKKCKRSGRDETGHSTRRGNFPDSRTVLPECETSKSPLACISEKIPKVIIKRTSASAEFKCELSKGCKDIIAKSAKWQPAVKLERYQVLDSIVKDLKASHSSISARIIDKIFAKRRDSHHQGKKDDYKLSRSSSMSNLLPVKHKQRRMTESFDTHHKQAAKKTEDETVSEQKLDQKSAPTRHSSSSANFKIALKELKTTPKIETCFVKLPDLNEISSKEISIKKQIKEQRDDPFLSKEEIVAIKKEPLSDCPSDVANNCNPRGDGSLLKDASVLDTFELDRNAVIKIESSDESQSTIEILPASPDGPDELESQIIEDGDSELYSADAIPTQFELELEIADHSSTDLLDVTMPKLDPVANYSSRCAPTKESCSNQIPKRYSKSELSPRSKNSPGRDKHAEVDVTGSDKSSPDDNDLINSAREVSPKCTCSEEADSTKRNFCCNDSLIKEVLAAKETLKKCLSKSRCENGSAQSNARPKTAAEKKQGSSFDLKRLSETHSKSSDGPQDCRDDVTSQRVSVSAAGKRNKTETTANTTTEKSDQKHSKQGKSCSVREKSSEKRDKESHPKETTKDARECTTSLETLKRATSNEGPTRTICLGEKRRHSANPDNGILQLQDSQRKELSAYKIPKISRSTDQGSNAGSKAKDVKPKMENMPILEPEIAVSFDANSDADSSRSPPMITHQDGDLDVAESKLVDEKIITLDSKETNDIKDMCKKGEISITDFITQLACHEKATIKHRRYCNLCERWFPTTSRHRRHLAGYQHRHIELTQRRSIHALFMLFTGKPCPRLLPANVARNDCSLGELTPLQIAVQVRGSPSAR